MREKTPSEATPAGASSLRRLASISSHILCQAHIHTACDLWPSVVSYRAASGDCLECWLTFKLQMFSQFRIPYTPLKKIAAKSEKDQSHEHRLHWMECVVRLSCCWPSFWYCLFTQANIHSSHAVTENAYLHTLRYNRMRFDRNWENCKPLDSLVYIARFISSCVDLHLYVFIASFLYYISNDLFCIYSFLFLSKLFVLHLKFSVCISRFPIRISSILFCVLSCSFSSQVACFVSYVLYLISSLSFSRQYCGAWPHTFLYTAAISRPYCGAWTHATPCRCVYY